MAGVALSGAGILLTSFGYSFPETFPGQLGALQLAPGSPPGPSGSGGSASPTPGSGWEVRVLSYKDYSTVLALLPPKMINSFQFVKQLSDLGSGSVTLNLDDPWWNLATLTDGNPTSEILSFECLWQFLHDGVVRFEYLGETVQEQLVDPSEQRLVTITGPGGMATLKWAMAAPMGFPNIILKLDGIADSFSEVNVSGQPVLDTNIWNTVSPPGSVFITPVQPLFNFPGGAVSPATLFPSGTLTVAATAGTTVLGASPYDATDTLISAQVSPVGAAGIPTDSNGNPGAYGSNLNGSELTQFYIQSQVNSNYFALIGLSGSSFYCEEAGPDGTRIKVISPASSFDPAASAYWMITEQGGSGGGPGTFYFWTSPDGQNWTLQWQVVHQWNATNCGFFVAATYSAAGQSVILSSLNSNVTTPSYQGNTFLSLPGMGIWLELLQTAQARGTIPFVTTTLTQAGDSFGRPWTDVQNVQVSNGTDLYSLLQGFAGIANADYVMQPGFVLQVGQPEQNAVAIGVDRSQAIVFREGRDEQAKQRTRARNQIVNLVGGENSDGHEISATNASSITSWGQREGWFQTGAQVDPTSLSIAVAAAAADNAAEILSWTLAIPPNLPGRTVFSSFDVGDWVGLEEPNFAAIDAVRVVGIAVSVDETGLETNELTIQSYVQWLEQQLSYIASKLGGNFVNAPGTTPVAPSRFGTGQVPTYFTPAQSLATLADVVGPAPANNAPLVFNSSTGKWQPAGTASPATGTPVGVSVPGPAGTVVVSGGQVVTSAAPGVIAAPDGGGPPSLVAKTTTSPTITQITDATGTVRTIIGQQADGTYTHTDRGGAAPGVPDTPVVTGTLNGLFITWDGKLGGAAPLSDFLWAEVHLSVTSGFTPSTATLQGTLISAAVFPITGLAVGTTYYCKLVARNTSAVASAASAQASGVPTSLTASLTGQPLGVLNLNPYFTGGDGTGWAGVSGTFSVSSTPPAGSPYTYAGFFTVVTSGVGAAAKESGQPFRVAGSTQYLVTAWVYTPTTSAVIGFDWQDSTHTFLSSSTQTFTVTANTWTLVTTVQTSPSNAVWAFPRVAPADGVNNTIYFEAVLCLPQVPGSLLQAGTVTATQIAANTITAAQIAANTITAAQIAAGTITSAQIAAGTITASNIAAGTITAGLLAANIVVAGIVNGTTITGATIVADGTSGQFLVYSGTPASGNMIASVSGAAGTDASSNAYLQGITSYQTGAGTLFALDMTGSVLTWYEASTEAGPWTSIANITVNWASGSSASLVLNSAGVNYAQLTTVPQVPSSGALLYASSINALVEQVPTGTNYVLSGAQTGGITKGTSTGTIATSIVQGIVFSGGEPTAQAVWELEAWGSGTQGSTAQVLGFGLTLGAVSICSCQLGAAGFTASKPFRWQARGFIKCISTGVSGTWSGHFTGTLSISGTTLLTGNAANFTFPFTASPTIPVTVDTTSPQVLAITANWGSGTGSPTISGADGVLKRIA